MATATTEPTTSQDATTLAAWCSRSSEAYNEGAWQTALPLMPPDFRRDAARKIAALDLPADNPAVIVWAREM